MSFKYDIFLSHNRADKAWTERLAARIEDDRDGPPLKVFFDKWVISPGADIPLELEEGLQASRYVGLVLSPEALASDWVALERSTAIYGDPRSRAKRLIPLLRDTCEIPDMLARLNAIDFRREQDFEEGVSSLINFIRGRPAARNTTIDASDVHFREDADLLRRHRKIFDRPAFQVPCIWELFLSQLNEAVDDTTAAINTGSLYSRSGRQLASLPDKNEYHLPDFKSAFAKVSTNLTHLKRLVVEFEGVFQSINPGYSHHQNFYAMLMSLRGRDQKSVREIVSYMDRIDNTRNDILAELNVLLAKCGESTFDSIELSSSILKSGKIGGADSFASLLK